MQDKVQIATRIKTIPTPKQGVSQESTWLWIWST